MTLKIIGVIVGAAIIIGGVFWLGSYQSLTLQQTISPHPTSTIPSVSTSTTSTASSTATPPFGMITITQADDGKTIHLAKNERFLIQLGGNFNWSVAFDPSAAVTRVPNSITTNGYLGVYEANATGTVTLHATGRPICKSEMCAQYLIAETITLIIH